MNVIFVGGTGRCGTSITKEVIAKHPKVASLPFEYRFIVDPDGLIDFYTSYAASWTPYMADKRLKRLESLLVSLSGDGDFRRYGGWELNEHIPDFRTYVSELMDDLRDFSFMATWVGAENYTSTPELYHAKAMSKYELVAPISRFIRKVIGSLIEKDGAEFFVEDNTWNILFAKELLELIPEAKIIHVYRDPRDVVASMIHQDWCPTDEWEAALWYKSIIQRWFGVRLQIPAGSYIEIKLEDLVSSTEETVRGICKFTGFPYAPAMFDINLGDAHIGRWKDDFSDREKDNVESVLHEIIEELEYE